MPFSCKRGLASLPAPYHRPSDRAFPRGNRIVDRPAPRIDDPPAGRRIAIGGSVAGAGGIALRMFAHPTRCPIRSRRPAIATLAPSRSFGPDFSRHRILANPLPIVLRSGHFRNSLEPRSWPRCSLLPLSTERAEAPPSISKSVCTDRTKMVVSQGHQPSSPVKPLTFRWFPLGASSPRPRMVSRTASRSKGIRAPGTCGSCGYRGQFPIRYRRRLRTCRFVHETLGHMPAL